jgi:hypothetical protein
VRIRKKILKENDRKKLVRQQKDREAAGVGADD